MVGVEITRSADTHASLRSMKQFQGAGSIIHHEGRIPVEQTGRSKRVKSPSREHEGGSQDGLRRAAADS